MCLALVVKEAEEEMFCFLCLFGECPEHGKGIHLGAFQVSPTWGLLLCMRRPLS